MNQPDLFAPSPPLTRTTRAATGISYQTRRDAGIARALEHAEADVPEWTETAAAWLRKFSTDTALGQPFMVEDARDCAYGHVPQPDNGKAWGAAVQLAVRRGWITKAGYAPARSSNGSPKCLWRSA